MKKILFIEDDPILGPVYEAQLKSSGFEVTRATDGEAGLNVLQVSRLDLIVLDITLPLISGIELLQIIRGSQGVDEIPIVVFTNSFQEETLQKVRQFGVERILSKSQFVPHEVIAVINEVIQGKRGKIRGSIAEAVIQKKSASEELVRQLKEQLASCRRLITEVGRDPANESRLHRFRALRIAVRKLTSLASAVDLKVQAYFCEALDVLIGESCEQPERLTLSVVRTVTQSVDFLFEIFDQNRELSLPDELAFRVLVVDDDPISRRAVQVALGRIKQQAVESATAAEALEACGRRNFDMIFLDVNMPGMNGYNLCAEVRKLESNRTTPVIFITSLTDLQSRAQSTLSGGNDFIGKPFHFMELAVKTLLHLLRSKVK